MAISPIEFYGKFSPRPVDTSTAERMRALAGVGQAGRGLALTHGLNKKAEQKRAQADAEALEKEEQILAAPTVGYGEGEEAFATGEYTPSTGAGSAQRMSAAKAGYLASFDATFAKSIEELKESSEDSQEFLSLAESGLNGMLKAYGQTIPPLWLDSAETYARQAIAQAAKPMLDHEARVAQKQAKINIQQSQNQRESIEQNLAFSLDFEALAEARRQGQTSIDVAIQNGISVDDLATISGEHMDNLSLSISRGKFSANILANDELTIAQKLATGEEAIARLRSEDILYVENPDVVGKTIPVSQELKDKIINSLEKDLKNFADREQKKADQSTLADNIVQSQNESSITDAIINSDLDPHELELMIADAELKLHISNGDVLRRWVNSKKTLDAVTTPNIVGELVQRVYDLNDRWEGETSGSAYLEGIKNIQIDIISNSADGHISRSETQTLLNTVKQLSQAKISKATAEVSDQFYGATETLKNTVPPEQYYEALRQVWLSVEEQKKAYLDRHDNIEPENWNELVSDMWSKTALYVGNKTVQDNRAKQLERWERLAERKQLPTVTSQADYDKLKEEQGVGTRFFNLVTGTEQEVR